MNHTEINLATSNIQLDAFYLIVTTLKSTASSPCHLPLETKITRFSNIYYHMYFQTHSLTNTAPTSTFMKATILNSLMISTTERFCVPSDV
jgi:hypothetical protein